jgi:hypothetical protein
MKHKDMYICDYCDFECSDPHEMDQHEANHFGLTTEELHGYYSQKQFYAFAKNKYNDAKNNPEVAQTIIDQLEEKVKEAKENLNKFEVEHTLDITE